MLSVASRAAMRRLGLNVAAVPSRTFAIRPKTPVSSVQVPGSLYGARHFASAGRPKSTTKVAAAKTTTAKKTTATKAKKPTTKKAAAPKAKAKAKPKPKVVKKVVKKAPKPVDPAVQAIKERRQLKKIALFSEPKRDPDSAWRAFVADSLQGNKGTEFGHVTKQMQGVADAFKNISATERQRFEKIAEENARANAAAYKAWVELHSVDEINAANNARQRLKRIHNYPKGYLKTIKDERAPKHPVSSFGFFTKAKYASGDMGPGPVSSHVTAISAAWKSLSAAERQPYEDLARAESARYEKDYEAAFGRKPEVRKRSPVAA